MDVTVTTKRTINSLISNIGITKCKCGSFNTEKLSEYKHPYCEDTVMKNYKCNMCNNKWTEIK